MTTHEVANEIANQIGNRAFAMMGAKNLVGGADSLLFAIKGSRKWNKIRVTLDPSDTYTVEFFKLGGAPMFDVKDQKSVSFVYNDQLRAVIEGETGLLLSL